MIGQPLTQLVYNGLVRLSGTQSRLGGAVWQRAWDAASTRLSGPVETIIHGHRVLVNAGYSYPVHSRRWSTYNDPLVEIVHQAHVAKTSPVTLVDVGAAVGDTVLLVEERCPGALGEVHCIEGDAEFFGYLQHNLRDFKGAELHRLLLSDVPGNEAALIRTHKGTASAQGKHQSPATTLDVALGGGAPVTIDVLKIDTDGFDGKVLAGATGILGRDRPAVIFEWHPLLYKATGQDWRRPFEVLAASDYRWLVWFDKYGILSHVDEGYRRGQIEVLAEVCLTDRGPGPDWHYDVVAIPEGSSIQPADVAALSFARRRDVDRGAATNGRG